MQWMFFFFFLCGHFLICKRTSPTKLAQCVGCSLGSMGLQAMSDTISFETSTCCDSGPSIPHQSGNFRRPKSWGIASHNSSTQFEDKKVWILEKTFVFISSQCQPSGLVLISQSDHPVVQRSWLHVEAQKELQGFKMIQVYERHFKPEKSSCWCLHNPLFSTSASISRLRLSFPSRDLLWSSSETCLKRWASFDHCGKISHSQPSQSIFRKSISPNPKAAKISANDIAETSNKWSLKGGTVNKSSDTLLVQTWPFTAVDMRIESADDTAIFKGHTCASTLFTFRFHKR